VYSFGDRLELCYGGQRAAPSQQQFRGCFVCGLDPGDIGRRHNKKRPRLDQGRLAHNEPRGVCRCHVGQRVGSRRVRAFCRSSATRGRLRVAASFDRVDVVLATAATRRPAVVRYVDASVYAIEAPTRRFSAVRAATVAVGSLGRGGVRNPCRSLQSGCWRSCGIHGRPKPKSQKVTQQHARGVGSARPLADPAQAYVVAERLFIKDNVC